MISSSRGWGLDEGIVSRRSHSRRFPVIVLIRLPIDDPQKPKQRRGEKKKVTLKGLAAIRSAPAIVTKRNPPNINTKLSLPRICMRTYTG